MHAGLHTRTYMCPQTYAAIYAFVVKKTKTHKTATSHAYLHLSTTNLQPRIQSSFFPQVLAPRAPISVYSHGSQAQDFTANFDQSAHRLRPRCK